MPNAKPKQWPERVALVRDLRKYNWQKHFGEANSAPLDVALIVRKWVGANTFRAFAHYPKKPSVVFRTWGETALTEGGFLDRLKSIRSRSSYDEWINAFADDFRDYWEREMRKPISFGHSLKLPNLVVKGLLASQLASESTVWFLHVPLDSYTIQAVRNCLDKSRLEIGTIPSNASMGFVINQTIYDGLQGQIRSLAHEAGVPPIALDYLAWDAAHRRPRVRLIQKTKSLGRRSSSK
jgi:hypothetical protein